MFAFQRISQRLLRPRVVANAEKLIKINNHCTLSNVDSIPDVKSCMQKKSNYIPQTVRFYSSAANTDESETSEEENHEEEEKTEDEIRKQILDNALNFVVELGWSRETLSLAAEEAGYASVAEGMFARGEVDLVLHLVKSNNEHLREYVAEESLGEERKKTSTFIRNALEYRLRMIIPYIEVWPEAMALLMRPDVIVDSTGELTKMVDDIWYHAGDVSTDFNWYTKRGLLAKLFVSMQMVMVNDQSPDFKDSWEFLDRRMKDIATFGKFSSDIGKYGKIGSDVAFAGFTVLRNVAGIGERRR